MGPRDRPHLTPQRLPPPFAATPHSVTKRRVPLGFPTKGHFASHVLHMMAVVQLRTRTTEGRAYYNRETAAGKRSNEAMRCLKRRLSDIVYRTMLDDVVTTSGTGPGGHRGASLISSAARLTAPHRHFGSVTSRTRHPPR